MAEFQAFLAALHFPPPTQLANSSSPNSLVCFKERTGKAALPSPGYPSTLVYYYLLYSSGKRLAQCIYNVFCQLRQWMQLLPKRLPLG